METRAAAAPPSTPLDVSQVQWTLRDIILGILWFLGLFLLAPIPFALPVAIASGDDSTAFFAVSLIAGAFSELGLVAVAAWFTWRKYGGSWERLGFTRPSWSAAGWGVAAIVGAFAFAAAYAGLIALFDIDWLRSERDDQLPQEVFDSRLLLVIAGVVIIGFAPVCEEIFFRGFVFPGIAHRWGIAAGIVLSGLIFSSAHIGPNLHKTLIPILGIAVVFAFAYWRSGSLWSSIGAHLVFNVVSYVALATGESS